MQRGGNMPVHELTEEERERMIDQYFEMIDVERKHLTREELEHEIVEYLEKKHPCSLATCGKDGMPRISVVDYINDGLVIYIISEGGEKFANLRENRHVAIGIGTSARTTRSVRGVNIWGRADIFADDTPEFAHALKLFAPIIKSMAKDTDDPVELPKNLLRVIRVTPSKMVYHHNIRGIKNATWQAVG
jgi:nitroimidazol reductase NimA-like FMN-containing flavoprotein (pyridoxamine 5'-phosphate oxidase superfamily)